MIEATSPPSTVGSSQIHIARPDSGLTPPCAAPAWLTRGAPVLTRAPPDAASADVGAAAAAPTAHESIIDMQRRSRRCRWDLNVEQPRATRTCNIRRATVAENPAP